MSKEVKRVNMNGSSDPYYRYTMPCISLKVEGTTKMIKSVITNIHEVCQAVGRPPDYLITYLGQELSANSKIDKDTEKAYVTGAMDERHVQQLVFKFIKDTVQCHNCGNPETTIHIEGKKKNMVLYLTCKGCGQRSDLDPSERFVKYMILHPPTDANYGHAKTAAGAVGDAMATATAMDEERKKKKKKDAGDVDDEDDDKKEKKKKKKKDKEAGDSPDDDGDKKEKKKKKKKDKDGDDEDDGEKKKKKKDKKEKEKEDDGGDSWDDDWGEDTSEDAVKQREKALGAASAEKEAKLAEKMEAMLAKSENKPDADSDSDEEEESTPAGGDGGDGDDGSDVDIDDI